MVYTKTRKCAFLITFCQMLQSNPQQKSTQNISKYSQHSRCFSPFSCYLPRHQTPHMLLNMVRQFDRLHPIPVQHITLIRQSLVCGLDQKWIVYLHGFAIHSNIKQDDIALAIKGRNHWDDLQMIAFIYCSQYYSSHTSSFSKRTFVRL